MAGWLAFVKVVALLAQVNAGAAWVLALYFIAWRAWLVSRRWPWALRATFTARLTLTISGTISGTIAAAVADVLPRLTWIRGTWAATKIAACVTTDMTAAVTTIF